MHETSAIRVTFLNGAFVPDSPVHVKEGTKAEVRFDHVTESASNRLPASDHPKELHLTAELSPGDPDDSQKSPAEIMAGIAAMISKNLPADVSINHDHYLYGAKRRTQP
jgi:predicted DNA-binding antitoxin AbrB/MazE fold protein